MVLINSLLITAGFAANVVVLNSIGVPKTLRAAIYPNHAGEVAAALMRSEGSVRLK